MCDECRPGRMRQALLVADIDGPDLSHEDSKENRARPRTGKGKRLEARLVAA